MRLRVTGLTLTRGSVMASAEPVDGAAAGFASALAEELGGAGWYEANVERTIWYTNLVHFAGPVTAPRALVGWVADRRRLDLDVTTCDRAELLDWGYDGGQMVPVRLGSVPFAR